MYKLITYVFLILSLNIYSQNNNNMETATFGSGCFWCGEAIFDQLKGVEDVKPGYSGGTIKNPTYSMVSSGSTDYAEVFQIKFNPKQISFDELLEVFWNTHDPTTLNRQGADVGPQYRSVVFYHSDYQKQRAEFYKQKLNDSNIWKDPIVTEITEYTNFYSAEAYHDDYYKKNPNAAYCNFVITPKIEKFRKIFSDKLKDN